MKYIVLLVLAIALEAHAQAQTQTAEATVARLADLKGNVLVTKEAGLQPAVDAQRLAPGERVVTMQAAHAVVQFDDGCRVTLEENQRFDIPPRDKRPPCAALLAMPQTLIAPAVAGSGANIVAGAFAVGAGAILLPSSTSDPLPPVSPN